MTKLIVGAYAASPSTNGFEPGIEKNFLDSVLDDPRVGGLEIPFLGSLHAHDDQWFFDFIVRSQKKRPDLRHVMTLIPGVMIRLQKEPHFGLASNNEQGRAAAIDQTKLALDWIMRLEDASGAPLFEAIEIHSAPTLGQPGVTSSVANLTRSLHELSALDLHRTSLWLEHCDAYRERQTPAKGFLTLEDELESMSGLPSSQVGTLINWGRSAIEGRGSRYATQQIELAQNAQRLKCLIFSGATVGDALFGEWSDSHAPFDALGSQLRAPETQAALLACAPTTRLGLKMQALPKSLTLKERISFLNRQIDFLEHQMKGSKA